MTQPGAGQPRPKSIREREVAVEEGKLENARARTVILSNLGSRAIEAVKWVAIVYVLREPIEPLADAFEAAAGKETNIDVSFVASLTITVSIVAAGQYARIRRQNRDLKRLRAAKEELEKENKWLRGIVEEAGLKSPPG